MNSSLGSLRRRLGCALLSFVALVAVTTAHAGDAGSGSGHAEVYRIAPSDTDPAIRRFNTPHYVAFDPSVPARRASLLVFLPGTGGVPRLLPFFEGRAAAGYRIISLAYDDGVAIQQICPKEPDPECAGKVREKRIYGNNTTTLIDDTPAESIVNRLVKLLRYLDREHPADGWREYLRGDSPDWSRITLSGQSQGAGMAAFVAKRHALRRVVLLSSPWDSFGPQHTLSPWIAAPAATEPSRWYGCFHAKEATARLIARSYMTLRIPPNHVRVLRVEPEVLRGPNPYHTTCVSGANPEENFSFLFGSGIDAAAQ